MRVWVGALLGAAALFAQTVPPNPDWRKLGDSSVDLSLASPATGPVDAAWFSGDGSRLYVRTRAGRVFETLDFETWNVAASAPERPVTAVSTVVSTLSVPMYGTHSGVPSRRSTEPPTGPLGAVNIT